ncbi:hypothetical protein [Aquisphaera insulae]|uniref:hypothetical protein n=1 Tax=Aquisphaera insulae TaxID=2712864 RepID=UPI0013EC8133|nr:hypothetical protein [Aquisphaera insulae]
MSDKLPRRDFLQAASAFGLGAGLGPVEALRAITPATAAEARVDPEIVRFRPEIEPVVRWIEETPRDRIFDRAAEELKAGLGYRPLLAALFLAGIRNIKPRPVGFKFHAVMVINSAHLLAQTSPLADRLLPMFWALDNFKASQAADVKEGDWSLGPVDDSRIPPPHLARLEYLHAMETWDAEAADAAIAGLCRSAGSAETMEPVWRMAVRDQRNIGHKAIFAAQSWRTLQAIGWEHAEPVLRSLTYGMLDLQGDKPAPIGPYETSLEQAAKIRRDWQVGRADPGATRSLLRALREATPEAAVAEAAKLLNEGISPGAILDAAALSAGELMMRNPGIISLHATTATNALHYIHESSGDDTTRKLALLQAIGWQPLYRDRSRAAGRVEIDGLASAEKPPVGPETTDRAKSEEAIGAILASLDGHRDQAVTKMIDFLSRGGSSMRLFAAVRKVILHRATDSHDYKFGAAIWEECLAATDPRWRAPLAAAALYQIPGPSAGDSPLMTRAREAIGRAI